MKKEKTAGSISTFLGAETIVEGTIEFQGTIRIDGNVEGKIYSDSGTVIVGENAVIKAEINVDVAIIMGEINGVVNAKDKIELYPPSRVIGEIQAPIISIETGVIFNGNCVMKARTISSINANDMLKKESEAVKEVNKEKEKEN